MTLLLLLLSVFAGSFALLPASANVIENNDLNSNLVSNKLFNFVPNKT